MGRLGLVLVALLLGSCAARQPMVDLPVVELDFEGGQRVQVRLLGMDAGLENAFMGWVEEGVYTEAPVYRQLPGVFILAGKPRLKGEGFVPGTILTPEVNRKGEIVVRERPEARAGYVGLVVHADGTIGPELIAIYGRDPRGCCEAPANVRIGVITGGRHALREVMRGDDLVKVVRVQ